jgi:hypothetical protein
LANLVDEDVRAEIETLCWERVVTPDGEKGPLPRQAPEMTEEDYRRRKLETDEAAILMKLQPRFDSAAAGYAWYSTEPVSGFSGGPLCSS